MGGGQSVVGVSGQVKGGPSLPLGHSAAVFSVGDRDVHKPQDRSRWALAAVWHPTNSD